MIATTTDRRQAIVVGALFLTATAPYLVGDELIASAVGTPATSLGLNETRLRAGVLLEFVNAAAVVGIGLLLFPILRRYREGMALGYVGARIIEAVLLLVSALSVLLLLPVSQEHLRADAADPSQAPAMGTLAVEAYDLAFQTAMIALGAGSLLLCYILYEVELVPRALPLLGFVGYVALLASGWVEIAGQNAWFGLYIPGALFGVIFPLWLIARGFNESTLTARSAGGR